MNKLQNTLIYVWYNKYMNQFVKKAKQAWLIGIIDIPIFWIGWILVITGISIDAENINRNLSQFRSSGILVALGISLLIAHLLVWLPSVIVVMTTKWRDNAIDDLKVFWGLIAILVIPAAGFPLIIFGKKTQEILKTKKPKPKAKTTSKKKKS